MRETTTIKDACERVKVSRRTMYTWLAKGRVEHIRTAGGHVRVFVDSLWQSEVPVEWQPHVTNFRS